MTIISNVGKTRCKARVTLLMESLSAKTNMILCKANFVSLSAQISDFTEHAKLCITNYLRAVNLEARKIEGKLS